MRRGYARTRSRSIVRHVQLGASHRDRLTIQPPDGSENRCGSFVCVTTRARRSPRSCRKACIARASTRGRARTDSLNLDGSAKMRLHLRASLVASGRRSRLRVNYGQLANSDPVATFCASRRAADLSALVRSLRHSPSVPLRQECVRA